MPTVSSDVTAFGKPKIWVDINTKFPSICQYNMSCLNRCVITESNELTTSLTACKCSAKYKAASSHISHQVNNGRSGILDNMIYLNNWTLQWAFNKIFLHLGMQVSNQARDIWVFIFHHTDSQIILPMQLPVFCFIKRNLINIVKMPNRS